MKRTRVMIASDIHYCNNFYGADGSTRGEELCRDFEEEYQKDPYEALLLLGDYSLDHWAWEGSFLKDGVSNTRRFLENCLPRMAPEGVAVRMIAGNHEQFGEEKWHKLTGYHRRDHIVIENLLFVFVDTFGGNLDPAEHSDGTYIGTDAEEVKALMAQHPDKKVILCSHWFEMSSENEEFRELLRNEDRILCLFCGHNHISSIDTTGEENGNKPILYTGHFAFSGERNPIRCLRGYRELILTDEGLTSKYIVPSHTYQMKNVRFTNEYAEQDEFELLF